MRKISFIDLFCGIGGFRSALESVHAECVFSSDIDPHAQEIYQKNWGEKPEGDITQIDARDIPEHDLLCAGFPCQAFSISGNRGGFSDARGTMLYEILRIVSHHNPGVLLLEGENFRFHGDPGFSGKVGPVQNILEAIQSDCRIHFSVPGQADREEQDEGCSHF